jgi:hypothetical protein
MSEHEAIAIETHFRGNCAMLAGTPITAVQRWCDLFYRGLGFRLRRNATQPCSVCVGQRFNARVQQAAVTLERLLFDHNFRLL